MAVEIKVPTLGESVSEATVAQWLKKEGDPVEQDETIVELETDKVTLEVNAAEAGVIAEIKVGEGSSVEVGAILGLIDQDAKAASKKSANDDKASKQQETKSEPQKQEKSAPASSPSSSSTAAKELSPAVRKLVEENDVDPSEISGSGKDGRLTKGDVLAYLDSDSGEGGPEKADKGVTVEKAPDAERREERVKMTRLRQRIAQRLKGAQETAAILTTFNDVDMSAVMDLRNTYKEEFEKKYGVRLGFMSFFVKAAVEALQAFPAVNAEIDGDEIVYKNYYDIGVAVGTDQGLVVPVIRNADKLSFADIELKIGDFAKRARAGKLTMEELTGGTFTISNGGVYGSLMSTPILNPPQSAILGMHRIEKRPIVVKDELTIRPMMYLAMSYDHRIIDGTESVQFLKTIKDTVEDPHRLLLSV